MLSPGSPSSILITEVALLPSIDDLALTLMGHTNPLLYGAVERGASAGQINPPGGCTNCNVADAGRSDFPGADVRAVMTMASAHLWSSWVGSRALRLVQGMMHHDALYMDRT